MTPDCKCGHIWLYHKFKGVLKRASKCTHDKCTCKAYSPQPIPATQGEVCGHCEGTKSVTASDGSGEYDCPVCTEDTAKADKCTEDTAKADKWTEVNLQPPPDGCMCTQGTHPDCPVHGDIPTVKIKSNVKIGDPIPEDKLPLVPELESYEFNTPTEKVERKGCKSMYIPNSTQCYACGAIYPDADFKNHDCKPVDGEETIRRVKEAIASSHTPKADDSRPEGKPSLYFDTDNCEYCLKNAPIAVKTISKLEAKLKGLREAGNEVGKVWEMYMTRVPKRNPVQLGDVEVKIDALTQSIKDTK